MPRSFLVCIHLCSIVCIIIPCCIADARVLRSAQIAHDVYKPGTEAHKQILEAFPAVAYVCCPVHDHLLLIVAQHRRRSRDRPPLARSIGVCRRNEEKCAQQHCVAGRWCNGIGGMSWPPLAAGRGVPGPEALISLRATGSGAGESGRKERHRYRA